MAIRLAVWGDEADLRAHAEGRRDGDDPPRRALGEDDRRAMAAALDAIGIETRDGDG